jgi:hypothetical protein
MKSYVQSQAILVLRLASVVAEVNPCAVMLSCRYHVALKERKYRQEAEPSVLIMKKMEMMKTTQIKCR